MAKNEGEGYTYFGSLASCCDSFSHHRSHLGLEDVNYL